MEQIQFISSLCISAIYFSMISMPFIWLSIFSRKATHLHLKTLTGRISCLHLLQSACCSFFLTHELCVFLYVILLMPYLAVAKGLFETLLKISLEEKGINVQIVFQCFVNVGMYCKECVMRPFHADGYNRCSYNRCSYNRLACARFLLLHDFIWVSDRKYYQGYVHLVATIND